MPELAPDAVVALEQWVRGNRFHAEYLSGAVVSGRWATRGGGALQIPRVLRQAVEDVGHSIPSRSKYSANPFSKAAIASTSVFGLSSSNTKNAPRPELSESLRREKPGTPELAAAEADLVLGLEELGGEGPQHGRLPCAGGAGRPRRRSSGSRRRR